MPICKKCDGTMYFHDFGSMGSKHSNQYLCPRCQRIVLIPDSEIGKTVTTIIFEGDKVIGKREEEKKF